MQHERLAKCLSKLPIVLPDFNQLCQIAKALPTDELLSGIIDPFCPYAEGFAGMPLTGATYVQIGRNVREVGDVASDFSSDEHRF